MLRIAPSPGRTSGPFFVTCRCDAAEDARLIEAAKVELGIVGAERAVVLTPSGRNEVRGKQATTTPGHRPGPLDTKLPGTPAEGGMGAAHRVRTRRGRASGPIGFATRQLVKTDDNRKAIVCGVCVRT